MMMTRTLLLAAFVVGTHAVVGWEHLLSVNCNQQLSMFAGHESFAMSMQMGHGATADKLANMHKIMIDTFQAQAKAVCPELTQDQLDLFLSPSFSAMLRSTDVAEADAWDNQFPASCNMEDLNIITESGFDKLNLPSSCNYARWKSDGQCTIEWNMGDSLDANLQLTVSECPSGELEAMSIACVGSGCDFLGKPCTADSECGGVLECLALGDANWADQESGWSDALTEMRWMPEEEDGTCSDMPKDFMNEIMNRLIPMLGFSDSLPSTFLNFDLPKLCGVPDFEDVTDGCENTDGTENTDPTIECTRLLDVDNAESSVSANPLVMQPFQPIQGIDGAYPMIYSDCDANVQFGGEDSIAFGIFTFKTGHEIARLLKESVQAVLGCRDGVDMFDVEGDDSQFAKWFAWWSHQMWFNSMTSSLPSFLQGYTPAGYMAGQIDAVMKGLPSTCTPADVADSGECSFKINLDAQVEYMPAAYNTMTFRVTMSTCTNGLPKVFVDCLGTFCELLNNPLKLPSGGTCDADANSGCPSGYECMDLPEDPMFSVAEGDDEGCMDYGFVDNSNGWGCIREEPSFTKSTSFFANIVRALLEEPLIDYSTAPQSICLVKWIESPDDEVDENGVVTKQGWGKKMMDYNEETDVLTFLTMEDYTLAESAIPVPTPGTPVIESIDEQDVVPGTGGEISGVNQLAASFGAVVAVLCALLVVVQ